ncbi:MAG: hypothetical protein JO354_06385 [Verrucomicrobia bacterium]|nr:hypothetical protein [Verrucomicrobiota bacterium]
MITKCIITTLAAGIITASAQTTDNSFVGKWKMNPEKSQLSGLTYKIEDAGNDTYRLIFGDRAPETLAANGTEHKTQYGSTWALRKTGANTWKFTQKRNGTVTSESEWTVSEDGKTFTSKVDVKRPDGSTSHNETVMKRTEGSGNGLAGTWETSEEKIGSPAVLEVAKWGEDGYAISEPAFKDHLRVKTDGKDYPHEGPRVPKGSTASASKTGERELEVTNKLNGKTMNTEHYQLSEDGKTLTDTINFPGESKQEVDVYERQ